MDEYTRGVQDGLKAAADKWAARCARAEARVAELERQIAKQMPLGLVIETMK